MRAAASHHSLPPPLSAKSTNRTSAPATLRARKAAVKSIVICAEAAAEIRSAQSSSQGLVVCELLYGGLAILWERLRHKKLYLQDANDVPMQAQHRDWEFV
jgi:hypothetical protein